MPDSGPPVLSVDPGSRVELDDTHSLVNLVGPDGEAWPFVLDREVRGPQQVPWGQTIEQLAPHDRTPGTPAPPSRYHVSGQPEGTVTQRITVLLRRLNWTWAEDFNRWCQARYGRGCLTAVFWFGPEVVEALRAEAEAAGVNPV